MQSPSERQRPEPRSLRPSSRNPRQTRSLTSRTALPQIREGHRSRRQPPNPSSLQDFFCQDHGPSRYSGRKSRNRQPCHHHKSSGHVLHPWNLKCKHSPPPTRPNAQWSNHWPRSVPSSCQTRSPQPQRQGQTSKPMNIPYQAKPCP